MSHTLEIPMTKEFLDEFEDAHVDQAKSAHKFVFELITNLCRDAKNCKLAKGTPVNRWKDKTRVQETIKFKDVNLKEYTLSSNPDWLPKDTDKEDMTSFKLKLRDKTWEYLQLHGQLLNIRVTEYNKSTEIHEEEILQDLRDKDTSEEGITSQEKQNLEAIKRRGESMPTCIEEAVYQQIFNQIFQDVGQNIDKEFNAEFDEEYAEEEKQRSQKIKERAQAKKEVPKKKDSPNPRKKKG